MSTYQLPLGERRKERDEALMMKEREAKKVPKAKELLIMVSHPSPLIPHLSFLISCISPLTPHPSPLTPHLPAHLTPHTPPLTPHPSHLTPHTSYLAVG